MKTLALIVARFVQTLHIEVNSEDAVLCRETTDALIAFYAGGVVPSDELHLVEEMYFSRFLAARLEAYIGERGVFIKKGDDPQGRINPAVNAAIRARGRYAKIMHELAKRHGVARKRDVSASASSMSDTPRVGEPSTTTYGIPVAVSLNASAKGIEAHSTASSPSASAVALPHENRSEICPEHRHAVDLPVDRENPEVLDSDPAPADEEPVFMNHEMRREAKKEAERLARQHARKLNRELNRERARARERATAAV